MIEPILNIGKSITIIEDLKLRSILGIGYSFLLYSNQQLANEYLINNESGLNINPKLELNISYKWLTVYLHSGLKIIFEEFGNDSIDEIKTMNVLTTGMGLYYGF
jgi:hypothetical protein